MRASPAIGPECEKVYFLLGRLVLAIDLKECEGPQRLCSGTRAQGAEHLADLAILMRAMHGDQRIGRMLRERCGKRALLGGGAPRRIEIRRAEIFDEMRRQGLDRG